MPRPKRTPEQRLEVQKRIVAKLREVQRRTYRIPVVEFCKLCGISPETFRTYPQQRAKLQQIQSRQKRHEKCKVPAKAKTELAKGKTYPTVEAFCNAAGFTTNALRHHPKERKEALARVKRHSIETDAGYTFRHPECIRERILEALEDGALELGEMVDLLDFKGKNYKSRYDQRRRIDELLKGNSELYRYTHAERSRYYRVIYSLSPLRCLPWSAEPSAKTVERGPKAVPQVPTEEPLIEGGRVVGKVVKLPDQPPMRVWMGDRLAG
jgi:hypothetical protein